MRLHYEHPPAAHHHQVGDKRRSPRLEVFGQVEGRVTSLNQRIAVRDISLGGFAAESDAGFAPGSVHKFRFTTTDGIIVDLWARAAHTRHETSGGWLSGFHFLYQDRAQVREAIGCLIDSVTGYITFS